MKTLNELEHYLQTDVFELLAGLKKETPALWGAMDARQMVEHLSLSVELSNGTRDIELTSPLDKLDKIRNIGLMSDRPLQRGVKNVALPSDPLPYMYESLDKATEKLKLNLELFRNYFISNPGGKRMHNVFGELDYHEWLWLHYKHFTHHFTQFGLVEPVERLI